MGRRAKKIASNNLARMRKAKVEITVKTEQKMKSKITPKTERGVERRGFLKLAGLGAAASVGALATQLTGKAEAKPTVGGKEVLYRETDHVKTAYETARF